jgi:hypothetical protein
MTVPLIKSSSANHWCGLTVRPSTTTTRMAVVSVLSWYVHWKTAASRFSTAMNRALFWMV